MSDLSDERLDDLVSVTSKNAMMHVAAIPDIHTALLDLRRHRAAQAASKERVRQVVRDASLITLEDQAATVAHGGGVFVNGSKERRQALVFIADCIASRVAEQLGGPELSADERATLLRLRANEAGARESVGHLSPSVVAECDRAIALLDRLLGGSK